MNRTLAAVCTGLGLCYLCTLAVAGPHVDRLFVNGKIWTGDESQPVVEAMAISGDTILAIGESEDIRRLGSADTAVLDLNGRLVVPGFQDSHIHVLSGSANNLELDGIESVEEIQEQVLAFAEAHPELPWITGSGWGYSAFPDNTVHRKYIDAVIADRPVYLVARDGHMGLGNSKAFEMAGITSGTRDPPNGHIVREDDGTPTGELKEAAQQLVTRHIPDRTPDQRYRDLLYNMDRFAAAGITSLQDAGTSLDDVAVYARAANAGRLKQRIAFAMMMLPNEGGAPDGHTMERPLTQMDLKVYDELRAMYRGPLLTMNAVKGVTDGTIDARTAAMVDPYVGGGTGIPFWEQKDLNQTVALYDRRGYQVLLHAIGDKAINMALDAFEYASEMNGKHDRRHRVEHAEMPLLSDLERFRKLGVVASTQPMFANPDPTVLENFAVLLGPDRAQHADSFGLYDDAGVSQVFGSDWSVFTFDVLRGIEVAVTRMTDDGQPPGGWYPDGRISVESAVRHYTVDAAYGSFQEDVRGTLIPGKLADLVVLSRDIFSIPPTQISETEVLLTVMGGNDTYRSKELE